MAITQEDIISKAKSQRSGMIDTYTPFVVAAKADILAELIDRRNLMEDYLFKTGSYVGIQTLIEAYFNVCINLRTSGSQSDLLDKATIETWTFDSNPVFEADGTLTTPTSTYITDNNLTLGVTSIFTTLIDLIGSSASSVGNVVSGYVYASSALASAAMVIAQNARGGSGILGNRTKDNLPQATQTSGGLWRYNFGNGGIDAPDYWTGTFDTTIGALITNLTNLRDNYLILINDFYTNINDNDYIIKKSLFSGFDTNESTFYSAIQTMITDLIDYQDLFNYLITDFTGNRATINTELNNLKTYLISSRTTCENRITEISNGDTIFGDPTSSGTINEYRKNVLSMLVNYPDGIIQTIISIGLSSTVISDMITKQEETLDTNDLSTTEYIEKPNVVSTRFQNQRTSVRIQWSSHLHPNKYKIYRKLIGDVSDNSEWSETYLIDTLNEVDDIDPDILWTRQYYIDVTANPNEDYVYRIKAIDDYWSTHGVSCSNSESSQSDVWIDSAINPKASTQ
jgi:hypothetical protein